MKLSLALFSENIKYNKYNLLYFQIKYKLDKFPCIYINEIFTYVKIVEGKFLLNFQSV